MENKNAENELDKWIDPQSKSCYCSEEFAEPCTSEDLVDINNINQIMDNTFCEYNNNDNNKNNNNNINNIINIYDNNILGDNVKNIFVALSEYKILQCNDKEKKDIIKKEQLYNYCKYGLNIWDNKNMYDYLNCLNVISYNKKDDKTCIRKCENIKKLCNIVAQFYSFEVCKKYYENNKHTEDIYINNFKYFSDHCKYIDPTNRGLVLCKHKNVECVYSQWSEWSTCSKTCIENEYDTNSTRTRTRILLNKFEVPSKSCSFIINEKNNLMDINFCSYLPSCNKNNDMKKKDDERIMPFVISIKEIEKLNTLKYLNNDDNDLLNENYKNYESVHKNNECEVTDMYQYEYAISYNEKNKSCSCPNNQSPCYFKDIYNSESWKKSLHILCKHNPHINVITADYIIIDCNMSISIKKKEIAVNTYLAMTFNCHSDIFQYIFCAKNIQSIRTNFIYIIITCAFGFISAIYIIHIFINKWHIFKLLLHKQNKKKSY
ncbi:thrombospondin protein-1 [Plasmodium falciparum RAJ116]|uniref:Thrombospondin protein-1 n=1 Tax=Plasmodium falciparum RAJ116 TaxID=580058 RepID=A0A0L0CY54_PLAFA|nr:thrombospondin protein-1 [Plasmodium falciparum RAJ116]